MKRIFTVVAAVFMLLVNVPLSFAADDITGHYFEKDMRTLIEKGIMKGYEQGVYKPDASVTRAEFTAFIVRALELEPVRTVEFSVANLADSKFSDVKAGAWYYSAINTAVETGIVNGYPDGSFKPGKEISRQEMAVMAIRAVSSKGVLSETAKLTFKDLAEIHPSYIESVQRAVYLKLMSGNADGTFAPLSMTTRGQTAAVINRMMNLVEPPKSLDYKVAAFNSDGTPNILKEYDSFETAKANITDKQAVLYGNNIVYMKKGIAAANKFTIIHNRADLTDSGRTYVNTGTEFNYFDATEKSVKIQLGDTIGYVSSEDVNLIPSVVSNERSYYKRTGKELYHTVYNPITKAYGPAALIGLAPSFMAEEQIYYSWNGVHFTTASGSAAGEAYTYFNFLPLHGKTSYTVEDIDRFLTEKFPSSYKGFQTSPLAGTGKDFKEMEAKYEVNALYLMAHAIHESAWGTSAIAQDKKNLYGMKAYDGSPYESATKYESFRDSIEEAAKYIAQAYQSPKGSYYNGAVLGNKSVGMNVKYASDPYWGERIAGHMYRADQFLGSKDINKYKLAVSNVESLNVRSGYGTSYGIIYEMKISGIPFVYTETAQKDGALWYKLISDEKTNRNGHVYGKGSLGTFVKEAKLAK
ncbi:S-layer family protein [Cytobacillus firmus]|uniref:S-layer family protein n=2 Tax=Cytobacillus TaxID=2675230 RepID=A0A366JSF9_CYTFI|nr:MULTISPECIES: S-layer homology domain-containing protein [Cytobacillus]RBP91537.1 S-layer family protein [Cytobacillus firmus]TDX41737.1 S-layer family protein [Cytobacillus oceanisediminis]